MSRTTCNAVRGIHECLCVFWCVCVFVWHLTHLLRCGCDYVCVCVCRCPCSSSMCVRWFPFVSTNHKFLFDVKSLWSWPQFLVIANKMLRELLPLHQRRQELRLRIRFSYWLRFGFLKPLCVCVCVLTYWQWTEAAAASPQPQTIDDFGLLFWQPTFRLAPKHSVAPSPSSSSPTAATTAVVLVVIVACVLARSVLIARVAAAQT